MHATDSQTAEFAGGDTLCKQPEARALAMWAGATGTVAC